MQQTYSTYDIIRGVLLLLLFLVGGAWVFVRVLKRSEDPPQLIFKWVLTALIVGVMFWKVAPIVGEGGYLGAFVGIPATAVCGLALAIVWRHNIASMFARPFTSLYDGGTAEIEPQPYYSIAEAKRKRGLYIEAVAEIRKQLARFPTDLQGQMMLAEIQAENLNDIEGADLTIQRICGQPGHAPINIAFALNTLADWRLKYGQDREGAQQALEKIVALYPGTELAIRAAQRIGHLATTERMIEPYDRQSVLVPEGVKNLGLLQSSAHLAPVETEPAKLAAHYVQHLEQHPFDSEAREKLAIIYADHYQRLDLAADQLDQLIELPNQPAKGVVHWLNLLADLQIRHGADYDIIHQTLERIVDRYPDHAAADLARTRMDLLKLELKGKVKNQDVKLGTYEQNIGLKHGAPRQY
jgi:outer membrane protein assembly factor BamD (BamD/ComL family)